MSHSGHRSARIIWVFHWSDGEMGWNSSGHYCGISSLWMDCSVSAQELGGRGPRSALRIPQVSLSYRLEILVQTRV